MCLPEVVCIVIVSRAQVSRASMEIAGCSDQSVVASYICLPTSYHYAYTGISRYNITSRLIYIAHQTSSATVTSPWR